MSVLWLDTETYSECDLTTHGTHRYATDPSTEIIVVQWAVDDGEPKVWDCTAGERPDLTSDLFAALMDPDVIVHAHNSFFDRTILREVWGIDVPVERWRDTMIQAYAHGLPGNLGKAGLVLGLPDDEQKDKRGKQLIQLFCKPQPKNHKLRRATRETHPEEWQEFLWYSRQDIVAMRAVAKALPVWNYGPGEIGTKIIRQWHADQRANDRGFLVDLDLAHAAIRATDAEKARLKSETRELTAGEVGNISQRDQLLRFILEAYGVSLPDLKADTLRRRIEDPELPAGVRLLLEIRLEASKASTAKYAAAVRSVSDDGRLRGTMQFGGAQRTLRWAHRMVQPGNMPRPTLHLSAEEMEGAIWLLKHDRAGEVFEDVMELASNTVRGLIIAPPGRKYCVADLANIEGRGLVALADEQWKLNAFRSYDEGTGPDLYKLAYARSFNVDPAAIGKDQRRQIGKVQELGLGYQGGVAAFLTFAAVYALDLEEMARAVWETAGADAIADAQGVLAWAKRKRRSTFGLSDEVYVACEVLKASWRAAHPATVALWAAAENAVGAAIHNPGQTFDAGPHVRVQRDGAWLRCRLPSGRYVCYLQPKVENGQITYMGVSQYTRQWTRIKTYGGKLVENWNQAWARDVFAERMEEIEGAGYEPVVGIHDEWITETPDTPEFTGEKLAAIMAQPIEWAANVPLAAAGFECYRYRKD